MEIYLLRHGIAEEPRPDKRDADRALTSEGKKKLREILRLARNSGVKPALVLTSPLRRAVETAKLAGSALGCPADAVICRCLVPGARPEETWEEIRAHRDAQQILAAGHEPLFGRLAAFLLDSPGLQIDVKKGSIIRIDVDQFGPQPRGVLKWMLVPRLAAAAQ
jgi:phosphohistidine phosphatase